MNFDSMTFPLTVDVSGNQYWISDEGPYKLGMAATEFMADGSDGEMMEELTSFLTRSSLTTEHRKRSSAVFRNGRSDAP